MTIFNVVTETVGEVNVTPRIAKVFCDNTYAEVTTAGFLNAASYSGINIAKTDIVAVTYSTGTTQLFTVSISAGIITLAPMLGSVTLPITNGDIAIFDGTTGTLKDGLLAGNKLLTSGITTPDVGSNLIAFDITVPVASLATGGSVTMVTSSGSKQYKIRSLQLNSGGTNFSGGGGDRLGQVTDGTTVYSVVPAATMQSLANAQWGVTALPNPASAAINTSTAAGANLVFKYSGGTTDYTLGSLVISGIFQRVA